MKNNLALIRNQSKKSLFILIMFHANILFLFFQNKILSEDLYIEYIKNQNFKE